ncbi:unnamed protein product [Closterium sp. NIES-54]
MADVAGPSYALGSVTNIQTDNQGSPPSKFSEPLLVEVSELTVELEAWEDDLLTLSGDEAGDIGEIREVVAPVAAPMVPLELPAVSAEFSGSLNQDGLETPSSPMLFSPFLPEGGLSAEGEGFLDGLAPLSAFHENEELPLAVPSDDLDELDAILFPSLPGSMASMASIASSSNLSSPAALLSPPQQCHPFHHREYPRHKHKHKHKYKRAHVLKQKHSQQFRDAPVFRRDISAARRALDRLLADGGIAGKRARSARGSTRGGCDCGHDGTKNERCAEGMPLEGRPVCDVGEDDRWRSEGRLLHVKREGGVAETLKFDRLELVESTLGPVVDRMGEPRNVANGATVANVADAPNAANVADAPNAANVADVMSPAANAAANGANDTPVATNGIDGRSNGGAASGADDHLASRHAVLQSNIKTAECHCRVEGGAACASRSEDSKRVNNKRPWSSPLVAYLLSPPSPRPAKRRSLPVSPAPSPISQGNSPSGYLSPGMETRVFRLPAAATSSAPAATPAPSAAAASAASADAPASPAAAAAGAFPSRRCSHCSTTTTPQWRTGPLGAKTLCNACGVRFKSGRLCPEYRPANSPGFSPNLHSNLHRKIVQMRERRGDEGGEGDCSAEDGVGAGELARREVRGLRKIKKVKECVEGGTVEGVQGRGGNMGVAVVQEKAQERDHESFQERVQDKVLDKVQERIQEGLDDKVVVISPAASPAINPGMSPLSGLGRKHRKVDIVAARRADAQAAATRMLQSAEGVVEVEQHSATVAHAVGAVGAAGAASADAQAATTCALQSAEGVVEVQQYTASADGAFSAAGEAGAAAVMGDSGTGGGRLEKKENGSNLERSMATVGGSASASAAMVALQRSCSSGAHLTSNFVAASA